MTNQLRFGNGSGPASINGTTERGRHAISPNRCAVGQHTQILLVKERVQQSVVSHFQTSLQRVVIHPKRFPGRPYYCSVHFWSQKIHGRCCILQLWQEPFAWNFLSIPFYHHFTFITEKILETCEPYARDDIARDLNATWGTIYAATVDDRIQVKNWDNWMEFWLDTRRDPYLQDSSTTVGWNI